MGNNKNELKPCPFCGGKAVILDWFDPWISEKADIGVACMGCGAEMHTETTVFADNSNMEALSIEAWNRRCGE